MSARRGTVLIHKLLVGKIRMVLPDPLNRCVKRRESGMPIT